MWYHVLPLKEDEFQNAASSLVCQNSHPLLSESLYAQSSPTVIVFCSVIMLPWTTYPSGMVTGVADPVCRCCQPALLNTWLFLTVARSVRAYEMPLMPLLQIFALSIVTGPGFFSKYRPRPRLPALTRP